MVFLSSRYFWEKTDENQAKEGSRNGPLLVLVIGQSSHCFPSGSF
jgi:hypothetical protein